jgi:hypothetical protein
MFNSGGLNCCFENGLNNVGCSIISRSSSGSICCPNLIIGFLPATAFNAAAVKINS